MTFFDRLFSRKTHSPIDIQVWIAFGGLVSTATAAAKSVAPATCHPHSSVPLDLRVFRSFVPLFAFYVCSRTWAPRTAQDAEAFHRLLHELLLTRIGWPDLKKALLTAFVMGSLAAEGVADAVELRDWLTNEYVQSFERSIELTGEDASALTASALPEAFALGLANLENFMVAAMALSPDEQCHLAAKLSRPTAATSQG